MSTHEKVCIYVILKFYFLSILLKLRKKTFVSKLFEWLIKQYLSEVVDQTILIIEARCAIMQGQKGDVVSMNCIVSNIINDFEKFLTYWIQYKSFENFI